MNGKKSGTDNLSEVGWLTRPVLLDFFRGTSMICTMVSFILTIDGAAINVSSRRKKSSMRLRGHRVRSHR
jgi:hypothetical protein